MSFKKLVSAFIHSAQMMLQSSELIDEKNIDKTLEEIGRDELIEDEVYIQQRDQLFEEYGYDKLPEAFGIKNDTFFITLDNNSDKCLTFTFLKDEPNMLKLDEKSNVVIDMYDLDVLDYILANIALEKKEVV